MINFISYFAEAYDLAQQIFQYQASEIKLPARNETGQPIVEPDRGQYLKFANTIQRLNHRECIMRKFENERSLAKNIVYIPKTKESSILENDRVHDLKNYLL